jgi:CheY-like chemotaxis protein
MNETAVRDLGWAWPSADHSRDTSGGTCDSRGPGQREAASKSCSAAASPATATTLGRSVLIVEDDKAARTAITKLLRRQGFAVSEAGTVADAIAELARAPQWVLLDLMLPDGCGISVLRKVREDHIAAKVCIITGCDSEMLRAARSEGAEYTFVKPLDVTRLMTVMCA